MSTLVGNAQVSWPFPDYCRDRGLEGNTFTYLLPPLPALLVLKSVSPFLRPTPPQMCISDPPQCVHWYDKYV